MASQVITLAKIGGKAGDHLWAMFQRWYETRSADQTSEISSDQWPTATHEAVEQFVTNLEQCRNCPSVLYYAQWLDSWSMGDVFQACFLSSDGAGGLHVCSPKYELFAYRLPDEDRLLNRTKSRRRNLPDQEEWLRWHLRQAMGAWSSIAQQSTLVLVRNVVGGMATAEEVEASLDLTPDWLP